MAGKRKAQEAALGPSLISLFFSEFRHALPDGMACIAIQLQMVQNNLYDARVVCIFCHRMSRWMVG